MHDRTLIIFEAITELIERFEPDVLAVETQYVAKNPQSALKLGMARGVIALAARRKGVVIAEYAPSKAKLAVTGSGKASKAQVVGMTQSLLKLAQPPTPEDAADALALAICHAHMHSRPSSLVH
jgi:crossover junction endodeoxyribonuclease RuvC